MTFRVFHRAVARGSLVFIAMSALTGLLWAYAPHLYWAPGYMTRKHDIQGPNLDAARIELRDALSRLTAYAGQEINPLSASLKFDAGQLLYEFRYRTRSGQTQAALLDAMAGHWLSPLDEQEAIRFARQYVRGNPAVESARFHQDWTHRKTTVARPVWRIRFADPGRTEIFIDPYTAAILEEQDSSRRFHFLIMKLHQYQFFGTNKELTIIAGLPLVALLVSGFWLAFPKFNRKLVRRLPFVRARKRAIKSDR